MSNGPSRVARTLATWFGCGLVPRAPGTMGTVGAIPLYILVARGGPWAVAASATLVALVGVWASSVLASEMGVKDPQIVVIDEVAGFLFTMIPASPFSWRAVVAGFVLFRLFDVTKPWPIRSLEGLPSGWGIVADDVGAGLLSAAAMLALAAAGVLP